MNSRLDYTRPIIVAMVFTLAAELAILLLWGTIWHPEGDFFTKLAWTATCGVAMGATAGALVVIAVVGRLSGRRARVASGVILFTVLAYCTFLCFVIDKATGAQFGSDEAPVLFIGGGLAPALLGSVLYGWLLLSRAGLRILSRLGL